MFRKIAITLFALLFSVVVMGSPVLSQPDIPKVQSLKYNFLYYAVILDQKILPAIYTYIDTSNFKERLTTEQQKELAVNIEVVFDAYIAKYKLQDMKVTLNFVPDGVRVSLFMYFYEHTSRISQPSLVSIGRQIILFKQINNSEIEIME